jgi:transcription termination/antitermination protein NusA
MIELLQVADALARDKNIEREQVILAMEEAIQKAGRSKYGLEHDIRAHIDRKTGAIDMKRFREVRLVPDIENEFAQVSLEQARTIKPGINVGEFIIDELPPLDFGRIAAQTAKQVIMQKVRDAERQRQFEEFKGRVGEIINGTVKRVEYNNVTIDLGRAEALMRRDESLPREHFKVGDRIRGYIYDVREEVRGPQIFVSRSHPQFMAKLFAMEVPEIYEGVITIKAAARDPGSRAKIAVVSRDNSIDPVGACVGMRGSRVQAVVNELQGEKIDIVPWSSDTATFVVNALAPAKVAKVVLHEEKHRMDVVVAEEELSLAIGRRGQNVRLASMLTGWDIDILTEAEESERRAEEFKTRTSLFLAALDVDETIAQLLVAEGFTRVEELAEAEMSELNAIEGFTEDVSTELQNRAKTYLEAKANELKERQAELGIQNDLIELEGLSIDMVIKLGEHGVKTRDDLADLAGDELVEMLGNTVINLNDANALIMKAREHWFAETAASSAA